MKKLFSIVCFGLAGIAAPGTHATTATNTFNVSISLTSVCEITTVPAAASFTYSSFQTSAATFSDSFNMRCTNTLPISSVTLDQTSVTDSATNLAYTLALGTIPSAGTGATQTISITGTMPSGQAGTCASANCTNSSSSNKQRTITVTY
jgi:hypothetical protein